MKTHAEQQENSVYVKEISHMRSRLADGGRRSPDLRRREAISPIPFMMNAQFHRIPSPTPKISERNSTLSPVMMTRISRNCRNTIPAPAPAFTPPPADRSMESDAATVVVESECDTPICHHVEEKKVDACDDHEDVVNGGTTEEQESKNAVGVEATKEEAEEGPARSDSKSEEDLFRESEALARQLMEEESNSMMRRLEAAQLQYALQMDEESLNALAENDADMALALRLQREEHEERNPEYYEHGEEGEDGEEEEMTYEEMLELGDRLGNVKEERWAQRAEKYIKALPLVIFEPPRTPGKDVASTEEKCLVCQMAYEEGDTLKKLPCNHCYHADCIDQWLQMKNTCPVCKKSISTP